MNEVAVHSGFHERMNVQSLGNTSTVFILRQECGHDNVVHICADEEEEQWQCIARCFVRCVEQAHGVDP